MRGRQEAHNYRKQDQLFHMVMHLPCALVAVSEAVQVRTRAPAAATNGQSPWGGCVMSHPPPSGLCATVAQGCRQAGGGTADDVQHLGFCMIIHACG